MNALPKYLLLLPVIALAGCVTVPTGPSVLVLPGTGMNFEQFRMDETQCRQYAEMQTGLAPQGAADNAAMRSAVIGTTIGAVAGAAIGGRHGAGVGAGTGLLFGSVAGAGTSQVSSYEAQRRYDNAFIKCMYAKGHRVPVGGYYPPERQGAPAAPAAPLYPPPPPPATR